MRRDRGIMHPIPLPAQCRQRAGGIGYPLHPACDAPTVYYRTLFQPAMGWPIPNQAETARLTFTAHLGAGLSPPPRTFLSHKTRGIASFFSGFEVGNGDGLSEYRRGDQIRGDGRVYPLRDLWKWAELGATKPFPPVHDAINGAACVLLGDHSCRDGFTA